MNSKGEVSFLRSWRWKTCRRLKKTRRRSVAFFHELLRQPQPEAARRSLRSSSPILHHFQHRSHHEWYEYERCSTVAANALWAQVSTYVRRLDNDLKLRVHRFLL
jgi:hypothetical protein